MTGIVVIRAPNVLRVIHRAVLSFCLVNPRDTTMLQWQPLGDHFLQGFDVDVDENDDKTDFVAVALEVFESITGPAFCAQNVHWTWTPVPGTGRGIWARSVSPVELPPASTGLDVDMDLVGYGSLGR